MISEEEQYFMIQNFFERDDKEESQIVSYDFYKESEDKYLL
jgi:hypothetical protein